MQMWNEFKTKLDFSYQSLKNLNDFINRIKLLEVNNAKMK